MFENIVIVTAILIVIFELYRLLRALWLRRILEQKKKAKRSSMRMDLKPKAERDCRFWQKRIDQAINDTRPDDVECQLESLRSRGSRLGSGDAR